MAANSVSYAPTIRDTKTCSVAMLSPLALGGAGLGCACGRPHTSCHARSALCFTALVQGGQVHRAQRAHRHCSLSVLLSRWAIAPDCRR